MKITKIILLLLAFQVSSAQKKETITIPKGIVYNYCEPKKIEQAKKLIEDNLSGKGHHILQDNLIIGPVLWARYKDNQEIRKIEKGNVTFVVDDLNLDGKMSQSVKDSKIIWDEFRKEVGGDYFIRKATEEELKYYWSVISFDIDEPLLIIETKEHNYILNLMKKDLKLMWLDEAPRPDHASNGKNQKMYRGGKEITSVDKGQKETNLERLILLSSDSELRENTSVEDIKTVMDKINTIFEDLFRKSDKPGKIMIQFEMGKTGNEIQFAVKDDLDLDLMKEFEKRVNNEKYPNSKKDVVKFQLLFKVNSFNETE